MSRPLANHLFTGFNIYARTRSVRLPSFRLDFSAATNPLCPAKARLQTCGDINTTLWHGPTGDTIFKAVFLFEGSPHLPGVANTGCHPSPSPIVASHVSVYGLIWQVLSHETFYRFPNHFTVLVLVSDQRQPTIRSAYAMCSLCVQSL